MILKTPSFWYRGTWISRALSPLSCIYRAVHTLNQKSKTPYRSNLPVICIGNVVTGGSGKTPAVLALLDLIQKHGLFQNPVILTRGYGGNLKGPTYVDPQKHSYKDVGDEALLLAGHAPVIVSADRAAGAKLAELGGADLILMDDGLQNPGLEKTLAFLTVNTTTGFGNGRLLPAGPLREPLQDAFAKIQAVIQIGDDAALPLPANKPALKSRIDPVTDIDKTKNYVAFAGLGTPEKFKTTLEENGAMLKDWYAYPDHHPYAESDLEKLEKAAKTHNARLITTEKDFVRLPEAFKQQVDVFKIRLIFDDEPAMIDLLKKIRA